MLVFARIFFEGRSYGDFAASVLVHVGSSFGIEAGKGMAISGARIRPHMPAREAGVEAVRSVHVVLVHVGLTTDNVHTLRVTLPFPKLNAGGQSKP